MPRPWKSGCVAVSTARTADSVCPWGVRNRQRRKTRSPAIRPSGATDNQAGDVPNAFSSCFHAKNASFGSPSFQPSDARASVMMASRSSGPARRIVSSSAAGALVDISRRVSAVLSFPTR